MVLLIDGDPRTNAAPTEGLASDLSDLLLAIEALSIDSH
jgi:hypothetical protein